MRGSPGHSYCTHDMQEQPLDDRCRSQRKCNGFVKKKLVVETHFHCFVAAASLLLPDPAACLFPIPHNSHPPVRLRLRLTWKTM